MGREDKQLWKSNYFLKIIKFLEEYPKCFIVGVDNVGSKQMQEIRHAMRGLKFLFNRDLDEVIKKYRNNQINL